MRERTLPLPIGIAIALFAFIGTAAQAADGRGDPSPVPVGTADLNETKVSKLSSELYELVRLSRSESARAVETFAAKRSLSVDRGLVQVVVVTEPDRVSMIQSRIEASGGRCERTAGGLLLSMVPIEGLETLASFDAVHTIRRPTAPVIATVSQGVEVMGALQWHAAGRKGLGVSVGILDVGFQGYQALIGTELPNIPSAHVKSFSGDISGGGKDHGTAVAEVIHDVAPEAGLYLVNFSNEVELENAVDWLIEQRIHVINASWNYPCGGPLNGTGWLHDIVRRAAEAGILWVGSAGNYAQRHWSGDFSDVNGNGWHNFAQSEDGNAAFMNAGDEIEVCVEWDDWAQRSEDYDLYVWDSNSSVVGKSTDSQSGPNTHEPRETLSFTAPTTGNFYIGIKAYRTSRSSRLHLYAYPPGSQCAVESVARASESVTSSLANLRAFRDEVLSSSAFGRELIAFYYRHSPEVRRILLLHPRVAIEAAALLVVSRPAIRSLLGVRRGDAAAEEILISQEIVEDIQGFLGQLAQYGSPSFRDELAEIWPRLALSSASGRTAETYWASIAGNETETHSRGISAAFPEPGYMRHSTSATSLAPPADSPFAMAVGATNWATDTVEEFSSRGPTADGRLKPDIVAPDRVCTATRGKCAEEGFQGTSVAAAHAAGAAALVKQTYPAGGPIDIRNFLSERAMDLGPVGADNQSGAGRVALGPVGEFDLFPAPAVSAPVGGSEQVFPTFSWSIVTGAGSYRLTVSKSQSGLPTAPGAATCGACVIDTTTSNAYFTPAARLDADTTYYWQVQALATGRVGAWSPPASFTTMPFPEQTKPDRTDLYEQVGPWPTPAMRATVITHGWQFPLPGDDEDAVSWVKEMSEKLCGRLGAGLVISARANTLTKVCQSNGWDVWALDWHEQAETWYPWVAFTRAITLGEALGSNLAAKKYRQIHLIAHSAGANVIDFATRALRFQAARSQAPPLEIHETFLDAYDPSLGSLRYGSQADWADNYVDRRDVADLHAGLDGTALFLADAYNIDVTPKSLLAGCVVLPPKVWLCRHSRPYRFYGYAIDPSFSRGDDYSKMDEIRYTATVGFPLSAEAGRSLTSLASDYPAGGKCVMAESSCATDAFQADVWKFESVTVFPNFNSTAGRAEWVVGSRSTYVFDVLKLGSASSTPKSKAATNPTSDLSSPTEPSSWIVVDVTTSQPVDKVRFAWRFGTEGEGLLRVSVDGMLVRELDQRYAPAASSDPEEIYIGGALGSLPPGTHRITFRLDGFGSRAAGVELTNVELGSTVPPIPRRRLVRR